MAFFPSSLGHSVLLLGLNHAGRTLPSGFSCCDGVDVFLGSGISSNHQVTQGRSKSSGFLLEITPLSSPPLLLLLLLRVDRHCLNLLLDVMHTASLLIAIGALSRPFRLVAYQVIERKRNTTIMKAHDVTQVASLDTIQFCANCASLQTSTPTA